RTPGRRSSAGSAAGATGLRLPGISRLPCSSLPSEGYRDGRRGGRPPYMEFEQGADPVHSVLRWVSAFSEPRRPLLQECLHAFALVRRAEEGAEELALAREPGRARRLVGRADRGLGGGDRPARTGCEPPGIRDG